jgi:hypothetical protein
MQAFAPDEGRVASAYSHVDQQQMAVHDYLVAMGDRKDANIVGNGARPAAIDHGMSLPVNGQERTLRSDFILLHANEPLHPDVLAGIDRINPDDLARSLHAQKLSPAQVDGVLERLAELKANRQITIQNVEGVRCAQNRYGYAGPGALLDTHTMQIVDRSVLQRH